MKQIVGVENCTTKRIIYLCIYSTVLLVVTCIALILLVLVLIGTIPTFGKDARQGSITIKETNLGITSDGQSVRRFSLRNANKMEVEVLNLGAHLAAVKVPDKHGNIQDIILGYDSIEGYENGSHVGGGILGRFANRIEGGEFVIDGSTYHLNKNVWGNPPHHTENGGERGWNRAVWKASIGPNYVTLHHQSPDGDEGFPGQVNTTVSFELTEDNQLVINITAKTYRKATPINLTLNPYFNLAGQCNGTIYGQYVTLFADKYLTLREDLIPTGEIANVLGSRFDLQGPTIMTPSLLSDRGRHMGGGYNHYFCTGGPTGKRLAARVRHWVSGRLLEVYSNQPGLQFNTGNLIGGERGKGGCQYIKHGAISLAPQNYPDAPNHANFPDSILRPRNEYQNQIIYKFLTVD